MKINAFYVSGRQIGSDTDVVWAAESAANTQKTVDIAAPTEYAKLTYKLIVLNPSTVSDVTLKVMSTELDLKGDTRYAHEDTVVIPKSQSVTGTTINTHTVFIEGIFTGADLRLVLSNDTALGVGESFTATLRLREVN